MSRARLPIFTRERRSFRAVFSVTWRRKGPNEATLTLAGLTALIGEVCALILSRHASAVCTAASEARRLRTLKLSTCSVACIDARRFTETCLDYTRACAGTVVR